MTATPPEPPPSVRPAVVPDEATALAPAQERFHRLRFRQIIGAVAGLAMVGGLGAGLAVTSVAPPARATTLSPDDAADEDETDGDGAADGGSAAHRVVTAVHAFTATLDAHQLAGLRTAASGLRLGDLDPEQRSAALAAVRTSLSPAGWAQLSAAMDADDDLDAAVGGGTDLGSGGYRITLLDSPEGDGFFLQFGGRQLAVTAIAAAGSLVVEPELVAD